MKREKRKRGTQHRQANSAADAKMINPAVGPLDPDVLKTGAASKEAAAEFVPASEPLEEQPKAAAPAAKKKVPEKSEPDEKSERKSGAAGEYYQLNTPLEEKPQAGSATRRRVKQVESNQRRPDASRKTTN